MYLSCFAAHGTTSFKPCQFFCTLLSGTTSFKPCSPSVRCRVIPCRFLCVGGWEERGGGGGGGGKRRSGGSERGERDHSVVSLLMAETFVPLKQGRERA